MRKKFALLVVLILFCIGGFFTFQNIKKEAPLQSVDLTVTVLSISENELTILDDHNTIYTFPIDHIHASVGDTLVISYTGILDSKRKVQDGKITNYEIINDGLENKIPSVFLDNGIFQDYYTLAFDKLKTLSIEEKIGQLLLVRFPDSTNTAIENLKNYPFGGYLLFARDFKNKTEKEVQDMIASVQKASSIPLLIAVDEEGGNVVRISSNPKLVSSPFKSPRDLYKLGGFEEIKQDTILKSQVLRHLGVNLNLAPVVDVSLNASDFMYPRTLGEGSLLTSTFAKTVIEASKNTGVSYTLKHFPGYGNTLDTHKNSAYNNATLEELQKTHLPPFIAGIQAGAEAVLVSHNITTSIDPDNPASLSASVHNLLRNDLHFSGIIITDDLSMGATSSIPDVALKALLAGNDLLITSDYKTSFSSIQKALEDGTISEDLIDRHVFRILAWKYYKDLIIENQK